MKKRFFALLLAAVSLLSACGSTAIPQREDDGVLTVVATTYPIYLFANSLASGVEGVTVERLDTGSTSCLHDYNLTVNDMKKLERADVIAINGVGLEEFMEDALETSDAVVIDCSEGVELLENLSHHHDEHDHSHEGHDHGHFDPHYWLDPDNGVVMARNLARGLAGVDGENAALFENNAARVADRLPRGAYDCHRLLDGVEQPRLVTFHDGFQYFCHAFELELLEAIEEEAGSEASAKEIVEITGLVREYALPGIFTEVNGSDATANAIARETGCAVAQLSMLMDGPDLGAGADADGWIDLYLDAVTANVETVAGLFAGK